MKKIFAILVFLACFGLSCANADDISPEAAAKLLKEGEVAVIDVRTPGEFAQEHLKGAKNIDYYGASFEKKLAELPKDAPILVYCRSGVRSKGAYEQMKNEGFEKLYNLKGGIGAWKKAGLPVEK